MQNNSLALQTRTLPQTLHGKSLSSHASSGQAPRPLCFRTTASARTPVPHTPRSAPPSELGQASQQKKKMMVMSTFLWFSGIKASHIPQINLPNRRILHLSAIKATESGNCSRAKALSLTVSGCSKDPSKGPISVENTSAQQSKESSEVINPQKSPHSVLENSSVSSVERRPQENVSVAGKDAQKSHGDDEESNVGCS